MKRKKQPGGKLSRTETVTVRLDPKLRYLAELASRSQRRTLSSFIEWVVSGRIDVEYPHLKVLWDVDADTRFQLLCTNRPDLLSFEEQVRFKDIKNKELK